jgi:serine/threonine protein kinase/tetratricopeptide (TPR) repeat protein
VEGDATGTSELTSPETQEATAAADAATRLPSELATAEDRSDGADFTLARASRVDSPGRSGVGQVIAGRYTLREVLGEGGMGTVYRASQTAPVKRQVALKLIKIGMDSRAVLARFEAERQALALMDHPNIARVYDGGTTEEVAGGEWRVAGENAAFSSFPVTRHSPPATPPGRPFFVMELVSGEPITEYCDTKRLSVRARLELFVPVCQAVQHAHQKGIIHRDLKPSNVMVTEVDGRPTPKVIDFGVAKATEQRLTDLSLADTGAIVGTPTYMSPEQADPSSMDIDTRTDVYALGVILYELLAGSPPIDAKQFKKGAILEMLRMVREVDPPKPSTKVSTSDALPNIAASRDVEPAHLKRALHGDLDWIVMMALEKDRTRRYETANGLAADIQRHLAHEPVVAAPPSRAYRLQKFVRKHRGAVIAASLVLLALLGGLAAVAAVQTVANARLAVANNELVKSRAAVQARFELARDAIKTFHTGVSEDFLLKEDKFKELRNRLLKSASDFYERLGALLLNEKDLLSRRALLQANYEVAELTGKVGRKEDALAMHRTVMAGREALMRDSSAGASAALDVARSLLAVGEVLETTGKTGEAQEAYERAGTLLSPSSGPVPLDRASRSVLAASERRRGGLLQAVGKTAEGLAAMVKARALQDELAGADPSDKDLQPERAQTYSAIGSLLSSTGRTAEALEASQAALAIWQKLVDDHPAVTQFQSDLAGSHASIALLLKRTGKPALAEAEFRTALAIRNKLADDNPAVTEFRSGLAGTHTELGLLLSQTGNAAGAEAQYQKALTLHEKLAEDHPAVPGFRSNLAVSYDDLAGLLENTGKLVQSETHFRQSLAIYEKLADDNPSVIGFRSGSAARHNNLGILLLNMHKYAEAEAELRKALAIQQKLADENPTLTQFREFLANHHAVLARVLSGTDKVRAAESEMRVALAIKQKLADDNPAVAGFRASLVQLHNDLGDLLNKTGKLADAEAEYRKALAIGQKLADENPTLTQYRANLATGHASLGWVLRAMGRVTEAEATYREALAIIQKLADDNPTITTYRRSLTATYNTLGNLLREVGHTADALAAYEQARAIERSLVQADPTMPGHQATLAYQHNAMGRLLSEAGQPSRAEDEYRKALAIFHKLANDNPAVTQFRTGLAHSLNELGILLRDVGRPEEAESELRKELAIYQKLADDNPDVPDYRRGVSYALNNLAAAVYSAGRVAEARDGYDRAISLKELLAWENPTATEYRMALAESLRRRGLARRDLGDAAGAAADARRALGLYEGLPSRSGWEWFETACCHAALCGLSGHDGAGVPAAEGQDEAAKAIAALKRATTMGYREAHAWRTEAALSPLRSRDDFRVLLMDVAFPAKPFTAAR